MRGASPREPSIAENASAGLHRWIDVFLCGHKHVFVVKRSRLYEEFGGPHSSADDRITQLQRYPQLDVLPQFADKPPAVYPDFSHFDQHLTTSGDAVRPQLC